MTCSCGLTVLYYVSAPIDNSRVKCLFPSRVEEGVLLAQNKKNGRIYVTMKDAAVFESDNIKEWSSLETTVYK